MIKPKEAAANTFFNHVPKGLWRGKWENRVSGNPALNLEGFQELGRKHPFSPLLLACLMASGTT